MLRWLLAAIHLLALGIGLGAVWARGRALRQPLDARGFRRVFEADAWWGIAALLWVVTGLWRLLGGTEKATAYYLANHIFLGKMALFVVIVLLELSPMMALMTWRRQVAAGQLPDVTRAARLARISFVQAGLVVLMVLAATAMARGYGARP
jgi:putative membrane protein